MEQQTRFAEVDMDHLMKLNDVASAHNHLDSLMDSVSYTELLRAKLGDKALNCTSKIYRVISNNSDSDVMNRVPEQKNFI